MAARWKTVRVFISSTFRDMNAERDHLVRVVLPQVRESLVRDRIHLDEVDLRGGIAREQTEQVLELCLQQVEECRPFFIGILGERYGWVPGRLPDDARQSFPWIEGHADKSLTELEILHGVLNNPAMRDHALFFFRDPRFIADLPEEQRPVFVESPTEPRESALSRRPRTGIMHQCRNPRR